MCPSPKQCWDHSDYRHPEGSGISEERDHDQRCSHHERCQLVSDDDGECCSEEHHPFGGQDVHFAVAGPNGDSEDDDREEVRDGLWRKVVLADGISQKEERGCDPRLTDGPSNAISQLSERDQCKEIDYGWPPSSDDHRIRNTCHVTQPADAREERGP